MLNPNYYGAMMVAMHQADGFVSGANQSSGQRAAPAVSNRQGRPGSDHRLQLHGDGSRGHRALATTACCSWRIAASFPNRMWSNFPTSPFPPPQLARLLLGTRPRVALLSYLHQRQRDPSFHWQSAGGDGPGAKKGARHWRWTRISTGNCRWTRRWCRKSPRASCRKARWPGGPMCLIFPDLNAGNIGSKLIQHVAKAHAYGQILLGLDRPAADVSRGSNAHDVLGVAAIVGMQSIRYEVLHPEPAEADKPPHEPTAPEPASPDSRAA